MGRPERYPELHLRHLLYTRLIHTVQLSQYTYTFATTPQ